MSTTTTRDVRAETGISREQILSAAKSHDLEPYLLADCLREIQKHLRETAPERAPELSSWSDSGSVLLVAPLEQFEQLSETVEWAMRYLRAAQEAHTTEADVRKGEHVAREWDNLILSQ